MFYGYQFMSSYIHVYMKHEIPQNRCSRLLYHSLTTKPHSQSLLLQPERTKILWLSTTDTRHDTLTFIWLCRMQQVSMSCEKHLLFQLPKLTWRNLTMLSLGLASFFSVGALLNSSAGSTLSQLLYFPWRKRTKKWCFSEKLKKIKSLKPKSTQIKV